MSRSRSVASPTLVRTTRALAVVGCLGAAAPVCDGPTEDPEPAARTPEGRAVQKARRQLQPTGAVVDLTRIAVENKPREQIGFDLDAQIAPGFSPEQIQSLWQLRGVLEATPPLRSVKSLRKQIVEARVPDTHVYYSIERKAVVFVEPDAQDQVALESAAAGQLVYAFYDQGPGGLPEALYDSLGQLDSIQVRSCLLQGHARLAELLAQNVPLDTLDQQGEATNLDIEPTHLHASFADSLCSPGARFLYGRYRDGGWPSVLRAVRNPPPSSEQMMHPAKVDLDFPVNVGLPNWPEDEYDAENPIGKATKVFDSVVGELTVHRLLVERGIEPRQALRAAVGWDGDRLQIYEHESGDRIMIWRSAWDRETDAQQFAAAIAPKGIEPRAFRVEQRGRLVDAVSTIEPDTATRLHELLRAHTSEPAAQPSDGASTAAIEARLGG